MIERVQIQQALRQVREEKSEMQPSDNQEEKEKDQEHDQSSNENGKMSKDGPQDKPHTRLSTWWRSSTGEMKTLILQRKQLYVVLPW